MFDTYKIDLMKTELTKKEILEKAVESFGVVPGIIREMTERSLPLTYLYLTGTVLMEQSSLDETEINAIELRVSVMNNCESCIKGHSFLLKKAGLSEVNIRAIIKKEPTDNDRLNRLLQAAEYIYYAGSGTYPDLALDFFNNAEISEQEIFEIIGLISLKTISNYTNNYLASVKARAQISTSKTTNVI